MRRLLCIFLIFTVPAYANDRLAVPSPARHALRRLPASTIIPAIRHEQLAKHDQALCLALALYYEQREIDETTDRLDIAQVIFNRAIQNETSVCATIWAKRGSQFQWVKHASLMPHELVAWQQVQSDAIEFMHHRPTDGTQGATFFYNSLLCQPDWANAGEVTVRLQHTFIRVDQKETVSIAPKHPTARSDHPINMFHAHIAPARYRPRHRARHLS